MNGFGVFLVLAGAGLVAYSRMNKSIGASSRKSPFLFGGFVLIAAGGFLQLTNIG